MKIKINKIFLGFMLSYITVLIVPMTLVGFFVLSSVTNMFKEEIKNSTLFALYQARQTIDTQMRQLDEISYQLSNDKKIKSLLYENIADKSDEYFTMNEVIKDLSRTTAINKFVTDIFVYVNKGNYFLSTSSNYSPQALYDRYTYQNLSVDDWMKKVREYQSGELWASTGIKLGDSKEIKALTYCRSIPTNIKQDDGTVVALINEENVKNLFETNSLSLKGNYYIVNNNNEVLFSTDKSNMVLSSPILKETNNSSFLQYKIGGESYIGISVSSEISNWKYVSIIPYDVFMGKIYLVRNMIILITVIFIFLGIGLSAYLSARNYKPIKDIFKSILRESKDQQVKIKEDYNTIIETIQGTFDKNKVLEGTMRHQLPNIRSNFIAKLLTGKFKEQKEFDEMLELLNIKLKSELFGVTIIHIDDYSEFANEESESQLELVRFIIINISEELISERNMVFHYDEEGKVILITNYGEKAEEDNYQEYIGILKQIMKFIDDKFKIVLSAGVGNTYAGFKDIPKSYEEAKTALNQRIITGKNSLTFYNQISTNSNNYYYPMDIEIQIMNHARAGNSKEAQLLLDEIFNENFEKRKLPLNLVNCLSFDIIGTILKVLEDMNVNYEEIFKDKSDISKGLLRCETIDEIHNEIKLILDKVCGYINLKKKSNNFELKDSILEYVNNNYHDKNLSLISLSDYFNISNSYLSRLFKDHTGYNFMDYLTRVRIQKAKELMIKGDVSISEVADLVGYNSANSFIRTFKKYESITPGQFKEGI